MSIQTEQMGKKKTLTPKLRFAEFKDEWKQSKLESLLKNYRLGGNYENSEAETGTPLIKMGNLGRGNIVLDKIQYVPSNEVLDEKDKIEFGDLFFNTRNTLDLVGKVAIWKNELPIAYYNSNLMYLKFEDNFFMNYRLNSYQGIKSLRRLATGTTSVAAIYTKDLLHVKFFVPSRSEQQKIASFLSAVDEKIKQLTRKKELLEQYKIGVMQQLFSGKLRFKDENGKAYPKWAEKRLGEIAQIRSGISKEQTINGKYRVTRIETISTGTINEDKVGLIDSVAGLDEYRLRKGDILFSNINSVSHIGKTAIAKTDLDIYHGMNLLCFKASENIYPQFLFYFLNTENTRNYFKAICNQAVSQASINQTSLGKTKIFVPVINEQQKIADFISVIDSKLESVFEQIEEFQTFKKGLLQQMFI